MRLRLMTPLLLLTACGSASEMQSKPAEKLQTYDVEEPAPAAMVASPNGPTQPPGIVPTNGAAGTTPSPITVAIPQMAYSYGFTFRLPEAAVSKVQARHVAMCDALGPARCQVLAMRSAGGDDDAVNGQLKLRVATPLARGVGARLGEASSQAGGRTVATTIAAEDVSKNIVDTEARLRQRELLVARLTDILRTRQGKVTELVEAERSVAAAQEEIDQAKGWLTELRGRVAMATVEISYEPIAAGPAATRGGLSDSVAQSGSAFVNGIGGILQLLIFLAPWLLLLGAGAWIAQRLWPRMVNWRERRTPTAD